MIQTESPLRNRPSLHPATEPAGKNLITIASGKGGVGKTVLAISLEPPGGSPTGAPTGPVIAVGTVQTL